MVPSLPSRAFRRRLSRLMRAWMCALLVFGLLPATDELVESVVHLAHDGHLPHSDEHEQSAADEVCGESDEHGCSPLAHQCDCCTSLAALPPAAPAPATSDAPMATEVHRTTRDRGPPSDGVKPFLPPPIA